MLRHEAGWANPKVIVILAVVFLSGAVFGAAAMRQYLHERLHLPSAHDFVYHGQRVGFDHLKGALNLSPDFAKYYQNLEEQREDVTEAGKRKIFAVLTPDQKRRFDELFREPARSH